MTTLKRIAIQGERGSNSHIAAIQMLGTAAEIVACRVSAEVVSAVTSGQVDGAVLPIENSLHGAVSEHYDLLLDNPLRIHAEGLLRIEHHLIAAPGVALAAIRTVLSHPVALSQCRRFLTGFTQAGAQPFYDTAGSVQHVVERGLKDTAGVAPRLAAELYGGEVLIANIEDHAENFTRFHLLLNRDAQAPELPSSPDKLSVAFAVEHRPGTLVKALEALAEAGANLTKIESRPVAGRPWEYVFFVDLRYEGEAMASVILRALEAHCSLVHELGRYKAA